MASAPTPCTISATGSWSRVRTATTTLSGIEHLQFADGTIDVVNDGNPLFDTLYYLSRNIDVFHAGVDPLLTTTRSAGTKAAIRTRSSTPRAISRSTRTSRRPASIRSTTITRAAGTRGAIRRPIFDTTLYLIHNPDVAAAGIDPLAHYLRGRPRRRPRRLSRRSASVAGGFDAQYYLFHNPDVAAAGVDPLLHYNIFGWHEGRNPNAWFDTAGYLSHYTDVAAAGINPLQHYETVGWNEGRDPSAGFDTLGYLAANPDVAAAASTRSTTFCSSASTRAGSR